jgi:hypothetical protein
MHWLDGHRRVPRGEKPLTTSGETYRARHDDGAFLLAAVLAVVVVRTKAGE